MSSEEKLRNVEETTWLNKYVTEEDHIANRYIAHIAATIELQRKAKGYTQKELARRLEVSQVMVSRWENGDENFTIKTLAKLAIALEIDFFSPLENRVSHLLVAEGESNYNASKTV